MDPVLRSSVEALEQTWTSLRDVLADLEQEEWHLPTGCPGWDVQDNVAHISGLELLALGDPQPTHEFPSDLAHVRNETGRLMEPAVDYRRKWPSSRVFEEFCEVTRRRVQSLAEDDTPPDEMRPAPFGGEIPFKTLVSIRVFDCYAHEQDVRRATGRRGNLAGPAADVARRRVINGWGRVCKQLAELETTKVLAELDGETFEIWQPGDAPLTTLKLATSFENALALACGRSDADPSAITITGDEAGCDALRSKLGFTP
ncbi:MAG: maleylpyruvate isomerase family mycothiol-dependent enzyme [Acidimicrobiales bacterium]